MINLNKSLLLSTIFVLISSISSYGVWDWDNPIKLIPTNSLGSEALFGISLTFSPDNKNLVIGGYKDNDYKTKLNIYKYFFIFIKSLIGFCFSIDPF